MSRRPEAERDRVAPAWTINPVRGIVIGLIVIGVIVAVIFVEWSRPTTRYPSDFMGFSWPSPGTILDHRAPAIAVNFSVGFADGRICTGCDADDVPAQVRISLSRDGSSPLGAENCHRHTTFYCALNTPSHVQIGVRYYLIVYEQTGNAFVPMPAQSSARPNLLVVRFH